MTEPPIPLTALSEAQRAQATQHFTIIRSALEDGVTQTQVASTHNISVSTVRRWVKRYREKGLAGLADAKVRSDKGKSRRLIEQGGCGSMAGRSGTCSQPRKGRGTNESSCLRPVRAAGRPATRRRRAARPQRGRSPRQDPCHGGHPSGLRDS